MCKSMMPGTFNELASLLRSKVDKNDLTPMLQSVVYESFKLGIPPTETGLVPIELPQLAEPAVDADYLGGKLARRPRDKICAEIVEGNDGSLIENEAGEVDAGEYDGYLTEVSASSWGPNKTQPRSLVRTARLLPGERLGWWSSQRYDKRKMMRAVVMGAIDDTRTRILLDTGANVSLISAAYAKRLRLREVSNHGRSLEVRGVKPGVLETRRRALVKITLGWERVYEFEMWIMEHSAGVDVVLGTDFMIPAGVRLDLSDGTARLPDEVTVPLVKSANTVDDEPYGAQVVHSTRRVERVPLPRKRPSRSTLDKKNQPHGTDGGGIPQGQACVDPSDERRLGAYVLWIPKGELPREVGYVRLDSSKYNEWQVLAYAEGRDDTLLRKEKELYEFWLAEQPPAVEQHEYTTPAGILTRPTKDSVGQMAGVTT
ncbi:LOW QUALITY PROTEIN: hypothetical protein PHMEG_00031341 [Phytophthora megakarya]|uniref:Peptidase A2 domain-containing protein n=1 Tax=Phytophthora megakarya TaxID=4795 RepID=A0A225UYJ3_9STRA|nr:LOW QUALITY PROTEIN: hypothetical protein PHMEG_00031341 [Phytophthora megakarya]